MKEKKISLIERDRLLLALRRLNMVVPNEAPILSLYVTVYHTPEKVKEVIAFVNEEAEQIYKKIEELGLDPKTLKEDVERIKEFIEFNNNENSFGLAAFISGYRDLFLNYPISNYYFKNKIIFDNNVYKVPLVKLLAEQPKELFLLIGSDKSILYKYSDNQLFEKEPPVERDRQNKEEMEVYLRKVKDAFWPYFRSDDVRSIFLMGTQNLIEEFPKTLAKTAIQKIRERIYFPTRITKKEIEKKVGELVKKYNILDPEFKIEEIKKMAQRRMAVLGAKLVFQSLREGNIKEIIIDPSFKSAGWRCQRCQLLQIAKTRVCTWCGGKLAHVKDINKEIINDVQLYDIEITHIKDPFIGKEAQGIAAILRFT